MGKRPTIADIARRAGVTKAAVSFALNGQPGVSAATRERILAIAEEIHRTRLQLDFAQAQSQGLRRKLARPPSVFVSRE